VTHDSLLVLALGLLFSVAVPLGLHACVVRRKRDLFTVISVKTDLYSAEDRKRFAQLESLGKVIFLLSAIGVGTVAYFVLRAISSLRVMLLPQAAENVVAGGDVTIPIAMFVGVGVAGATYIPIMRRWWPEGGNWYLAYSSKRHHGGSYERFCSALGSVIVALGLVVFPFVLNWYVQARANGLAIHPFFAVQEKVFSYSEIQSIEFSPVLNRGGYQNHFFLRLKDGQVLGPNDFPSEGESQHKLMGYLSKKSGVPIKFE
jgi:hypothetical protein